MPELDRIAALELHRAHLDVYEELLRSWDDQDSYRNWVYRRDSPDASRYEGAIGEALAFDYLRGRVDSVRLVPTPEALRAPDFHCEVGDSKFLVEVVSRQTRTITRPKKLPANPEPWESQYMSRNWVRQIEDVVRQQSSQGKDSHLPRLILVTVLQPNATDSYCNRSIVEAALCETIQVKTEGGFEDGVPNDTVIRTDVERALFARMGEAICPRYRSVSGFIQAGFGFYPDRACVHGGLNPDAGRPFDASLLGDVPFASLQGWPVEPGEAVSFQWSDSAPSNA